MIRIGRFEFWFDSYVSCAYVQGAPIRRIRTGCSNKTNTMAELNIRASAASSITRLMGKVDNGEVEAMTNAMQRVTLDNLETHYTRFQEAHMTLVGAAQAGELDAHASLFESVEDKYSTIKATLHAAIEAAIIPSQADPSVRSVPRMDTNDIRLEKIHLPKFSGEFNKWIGFRDMFEAMVNGQENFTTAAKYTRLMKALEGDAAQVVAGFLPTDDNYESAWATLKKRYDNDRLIVSSHLNVFLGMDTLQKESSSGLRRMVDVTNETMRSLGAMKRPVDHWDDVMVHILVSKLPRATIITWEMEQKGTELPKLSELLAFLEGRARGLDHMGPSTSERTSSGTGSGAMKRNSSSTPKAHTSTGATPKLVRSNLPNPGRGRCYYCSGEHYIGKCPKLEALPPAERFEKVKDSNLCYNCLAPGHSTRKCGSKYTCSKCNGHHHTILCRTTQQAQAQATASPLTNEQSSSQPQA